MLNLQDTVRHTARGPAVPLGLPLVERRGQPRTHLASPAAHEQGQRLGQVMDMLDYGLLLVAPDGRVQHMNKAARRELDQPAHPLQLLEGALHLGSGRDAAALREALVQARQRGLRRLLELGQGAQRASVAVVPLAPLAGEADHGVALLLARRQVCEALTVEWFARSHHLTLAETTVVRGLCADLSPQQIAEQQGVGLATVRTQIGSIRMKTGLGSIGALLRRVSLLPPLVSALQGLPSRALNS
jgi:DNA-binding CsgD family transcriptional regulator